MSMDERTLTALKASIAKWERNVQAEKLEDARIDVRSCPLCRLFFYARCVGCPVADAVNNTVCDDTPYENASEAWYNWVIGIATASDFRAAAQAEVDFLKSLLPEDS